MKNFLRRLWQLLWIILSGLFLISIGLWASLQDKIHNANDHLRLNWRNLRSKLRGRP